MLVLIHHIVHISDIRKFKKILLVFFRGYPHSVHTVHNFVHKMSYLDPLYM